MRARCAGSHHGCNQLLLLSPVGAAPLLLPPPLAAARVPTAPVPPPLPCLQRPAAAAACLPTWPRLAPGSRPGSPSTASELAAGWMAALAPPAAGSRGTACFAGGLGCQRWQVGLAALSCGGSDSRQVKGAVEGAASSGTPVTSPPRRWLLSPRCEPLTQFFSLFAPYLWVPHFFRVRRGSLSRPQTELPCCLRHCLEIA